MKDYTRLIRILCENPEWIQFVLQWERITSAIPVKFGVTKGMRKSRSHPKILADVTLNIFYEYAFICILINDIAII